MAREQEPITIQESPTGSVLAEQHLDKVVKSKKINFISSRDGDVTRSYWIEWHPFRGWFQHKLVQVVDTGVRSLDEEHRISDRDWQAFQSTFKREFLLDPDLELETIKGKSPNTLAEIARKSPAEALAERVQLLRI